MKGKRIDYSDISTAPATAHADFEPQRMDSRFPHYYVNYFGEEEEAPQATNTPPLARRDSVIDDKWHIGYFLKDSGKPFSGPYGIIDKLRAAGETEEERVLSKDDSYIRAIGVGPRRFITQPQKKIPGRGICGCRTGEKHITGPHWIFEYLARHHGA